MQIIFRVETLYGIHDYDTLSAARNAAKPEDHIQFVVGGLNVLSRVTRRGATSSWAKRVVDRNGLDGLVDYSKLF